jgi:hypothetical protein
MGALALVPAMTMMRCCDVLAQDVMRWMLPHLLAASTAARCASLSSAISPAWEATTLPRFTAVTLPVELTVSISLSNTASRFSALADHRRDGGKQLE